MTKREAMKKYFGWIAEESFHCLRYEDGSCPTLKEKGIPCNYCDVYDEEYIPPKDE